MSNFDSFSWQYFAFTDDQEYRELQGRHAQLTKRFANISSRDPNFSKTYSQLLAVEAKIAEKQKEDWLTGCDDPDDIAERLDW